MPKTNDAALAIFMARKAEINVALDCIRAAGGGGVCTEATLISSKITA